MTKEIYRLDVIPKNTTVGLYGCGERGIMLRSVLERERPDIRVACFVDSFESGTFDDLEKIRVDEVERIDSLCDAVIVASTFVQDILKAIPDQLKAKIYVPLHGFYQWYGHRAGDTPAYSTIHIEANTNCNMRCAFCISTFMRHFKPDRQLDMETMKEIVTQIAENRIARTISILGDRGEPLVYKHLYESLDFIKEQGLSTSMISNGLLLNDKTFHRLDGRLDSLVISLHNLSERSFAIRGVKSSFDQYLRGIGGFFRAHSDSGSDMTIVVKAMLAFPDWPASHMFDVSAILEDTRKLRTVFPRFAKQLNREIDTDILRLDITPADLDLVLKRMAESQQTTEFPIGDNISFLFVPLQEPPYQSLRYIDPTLYNNLEISIPGDGPCSFGDPTIDIDGNVSLCCIHDPEIRLGSIHDKGLGLHDIVTGEKAESMARNFSLGKLPYKICALCRANFHIKKSPA